jgi:hypothetical protein
MDDAWVDRCGVVVYARTRGQARWSGAAELGVDENVLGLQVLRAPLADHLAESRERPGGEILEALGFDLQFEG